MSRINLQMNKVAEVLSSPLNTRHCPRHRVDLPVRIVLPNGVLGSAVPGRVTNLSRSGMAVHSTLSLKPGDLMQVHFPTSDPIAVTAVVRNRIDDCLGLQFVSQLPSGYQSPKSSELPRSSCNPKNLFASLRRKQLEIKQVRREIEALNLAIPLLADDERKNPESSMPSPLKLEVRPWPS
jgi:hypothetical protein